MSSIEYPIIAEGKTKIIRGIPGSNWVHVESKDDITAGDGVKRDLLESKGVLSTETTANCFVYLEEAGIETHFLGGVEPHIFKAIRVNMIPIELVARRIATGSYLQRCPDVEEGTIFEEPVIEFFDKNDNNHDPLLIYDFVGERILTYDAHQPLNSGFMEEIPMEDTDSWLATVQRLKYITNRVFLTLEEAWAAQDVSLVDLKIECGFNPIYQSDILVADVIDNDSWRIWPKGDKTQMKDKQVYRNLEYTTTEALNEIKKNYQWVAEATRKFVS